MTLPPDWALWLAVVWVLLQVTGFAILYGPKIALIIIDGVTP